MSRETLTALGERRDVSPPVEASTGGLTSRRSPYALLRLLGALALLIAVFGVAAAESDDEPADPIPLRRVVLAKDQAADALKQARDGVLVQMPRKDFEALVRRAALAVKDGREPPRLIEARYRATLTDAPALTGSAQWKIVNPAGKPSLLRLEGAADEPQTFNLGVTRPRYDNRDALLGDFPDPAAPGQRVQALLVDQAGQQTLTFDWSARVEPSPEGMLIDLRLPDCPAGSLELNVPVGRTVTSLDGTLTSGPHPAEASGRRLWRVACGGKTSVPLLVRRSEGDSSLVLVKQKTAQDLTPDGVESTTTFTIESLHQDVRELFVEADPSLRLVEVSAVGLALWEPKAGGAAVKLDRPAREVTLTVRGLAPLSEAAKPEDSRAWVSPGVRLRGAVSRGESLELWLHPQLRLGSWEPGDFRLTSSAIEEHPRRKTKMRRLVLGGGGLAPAATERKIATPRRPSAQIQAGAVEFRATQMTLWRLRDDGMELNSRIDYEVRQGLLFQLPVRLPAGWEVESVDLTPADNLRSWGDRKDKSGKLLIVDLKRPLELPREAKGSLLLRLRPEQTGPLAGRDLGFPDVTPLGTRQREGGMAIDFDSQSFRAAVNAPSPGGAVPADELWKDDVPEHFYPHTGQPLAGTLHLTPRSPRARSRAWSEIHLAAGRAAMTSKLQVRLESGRHSWLDVYLAGSGEGLDWQADQPGFRVRRAERLLHLEVAAGLAGLLARDALGAALVQAARPQGTYWRLHLDRPLPPDRQLTLTASRVLEAEGPPETPAWQVPLPVVLGAGHFEGEMAVYLSGNDHVSLSPVGLRDCSVPRGAWRGLRYGDPWAALTINSLGGRGAPASEASVVRASLMTTLSGDELTHLFRFRLSGWTRRTLPVKLPAGATLSAAAVDGRWLDRLASEGKSLPLPATPGEAAVELPVPAASVHFELLYLTQAPTRLRLLGGRLQAPAPELPIVPASVERRWRLPRDVAPLWPTQMRQLPTDGPDLSAPPWQRIEKLVRLGPRLPLTGPGESPQRSQALADALAALADRHAKAELRLGDATAELSSKYLENHPLLIDRAALAQAGLSRSSALLFGEAGTPASAAWDAAGLELLPCRAGVLLTTRAQRQRWRRESDEWPPAVESALEQAARLGRDDSGRFLSAVEWQTGDAPGPPEGLLGRAAAREVPVVWATVAGQGSGESLEVVRLPAVAVMGLVLAALLALGLFLPRRARALYLVAWPALAGLGLAWLPGSLAELAWWPLLAGLIAAAAFGLYAAALARPAHATTAAPKAAAAAAVLAVILAGAAWPARAQKPSAPDVVYVIAGAKENEQSVLVAPAVLKKLNDLATPTLAPSSGVVLLDAVYEGGQAKGQAEFSATLHAHCLDDRPAKLELPFDGRLTDDVLVDGARAFPVALKGQKAGFSLELKGKGKHKIQFDFASSVLGGGDEGNAPGVRQVRLGVPRLIQSRISFRTEAGASHLQLPLRYGGQKVTVDGKATRLDADLGAISVPVVLRWQQDGKQQRPPRVTFREAYLWELAPEASSLTAHVNYDVAEGAVTSLRVDLPEGLEPRSASARRPASVTPDAAVRLSDWSISGTGANRVLRLDFSGPVSGAVEVTIDLVPRGPWQGPAVLTVPRPRGEPAPPGLGHLAYHAQGVEVTERKPERVLSAKTKTFAPFWTSVGRPDAATLDYAGTFRRGGAPPLLRLDLRPRQPRVELAQDVRLLVGPRQAAWQATVDLSVSDGDLPVMEWAISSPRPLTVTEVKLAGDGAEKKDGAGRLSWTQSGDRLVVWLDRAVKDKVTLTLSGWLPLDVPAPKGNKAGSPRLDLPCLRPLRAASVRTKLTLSTEPGLALQAQSQPLHNLARQGQAGSRPLVYLATAADHGGAFVVTAGQAAGATIRTEASRRARELTFAATIELQSPQEQRSFQLRLRDWSGEAWLEAPEGVKRGRATYQRVGGRREWTWAVELPAGGAKAPPVRLTVRGRGRLGESSEGTSMPNVSVVGVRGLRVVAIDETLTAEPPAGLTPLLREAGQAGQAWRVSETDWSLRVLARETESEARTLLSEHRVRLEDGRRWTHEASWLLWQDAPAALSLTWPGPVELLSVAVDDSVLSQARVERGKLSLPPADRPGPRRVTVRWLYPQARGEPLDRPDLTSPRLSGAKAGKTVWTVEVPPGWEPGGAEPSVGAERRALVELCRAEARLELLRAMLSDGIDSEVLAAELARADRSLALAGLALASEARAADGRDLNAWRTRLLAQSENLRSEGARAPVIGPDEGRPRAGTAISWARATDGPAPAASLTPSSRRQTTAALTFSLYWLILTVVAGTTVALGWLRALGRRLWPEILLLLGLMGYLAAGPTLAVLFLLALGAAGRLILLVQGIAWLMRSETPAGTNAAGA